VRGGCHGVNVHHDDEARKTKNGEMRTPTWRAKYRSGFTTLPPVLLQEQPGVVLLLEGVLLS
jgi:hypothetical protein